MIPTIQFYEQIHERQRDAFAEQLLASVNGFFKVYAIYLGHRLGLYRPLAGRQALTSRETAVRTGLNERYVREWLEEQAVAGILDVVDARFNARQAGLESRLRFEACDAANPALSGSYDLVTAFECIHDMADPVGSLATMRRLAGSDGSVIVMDERTGEHFSTADNPVEQLTYGFSILACLPAAMAEQPSAATGTVMRPETLRRYAREAGFHGIEILPIDNDFFRFYRLNTKAEG